MTVVIEDGCIACGLCTEICPEEFEIGDEGVAVPLQNPVPDDLIEGTEEAAESCPVSVIVLEED